MTCANCGTENRAGRRFCLECGNPLSSGCPSCGAENEPEARFCGTCGTGLGRPATVEPSATSPRSDPVAERRLVTVLFADLVGFTPFAEGRDAEDVRGTLEQYASLAREVVARYGGTVEKFIGDAAMAVWGTPTAHEDDAERAVRAALDLVDDVSSLGADFQARAGVMTGEAAVNLAARDQSLLAGDLVNTAARLQSVATAGSVLVGESTMRATSAAIAYEPAGNQTLKGKESPVAAWRAIRVIAQRRGAGRSETLETPFVGRDEELRLLKEQLQLTGRDPRVRLVSVTGPAGIGKSRLAWELEKYVDGVVDTIYWHRGRSPAYGEGVTFWALGEMVRSRARLPENADEATTRAAIKATVNEYVTDEGERDWIEQSLLALLGLSDSASTGRELLFAAWRRFFENIAARGTTVLVFEDLHWADAGLLDFIDHLLDWSKSVPLLVVTLARPELFDRRPDWGAGRRTFTALALDPLPEPAMREMFAALVPDLPESALAAIVERADGIPLYAVETVRMLLADGRLTEVDGSYRPTGELGNLEVPESLRSLIAARLDALAPADRRLLQDASVLGQSFTVDALAALTGTAVAELLDRMRQLVRRELLTIDADPRSPERGQYGFVQSLIREVAYSTLARPERRARHLGAARYLEATGGDQLAAALAGHYAAAHAASAAGPEADAIAAQARVALRAAADRAASLGGRRQAAAFIGQALSLTNDPADRAGLLERLATELTAAGRYADAEKSIREAIAIHEATGDQLGFVRARGLLGTALINQGRPVEAIAELEAARDELPPDAEPATRADVLAKLARAYYRNNEWPKALVTADQAMELAEHSRLLRTLGEAMVSKGTALTMAARHVEALALLKAGKQIAERVGDVDTMFRADANIGAPLAFEEGAAETVAVVRGALERARAIGKLDQVVWHTGGLLQGTVLGGDLPLDENLAEGDELLALDLERADREHILNGYVVAAAWHGRDITDLELELAASIDPQTAGGLAWSYWQIATAYGDWERASREAEKAAGFRPDFPTMPSAVVAAALAGDVERMRALIETMREGPVMGRFGEAAHKGAEGVLAVVEGRTAEGRAAIRETLRVLREMSGYLPWFSLTMFLLHAFGPDDPEAREYGEELLADFERRHVWAGVDRLRTALKRPPREELAQSEPTVPAEARA